MKVQPTGLFKKRKHTCAQKNFIHTVYELGTIVNNSNIKLRKKKITSKVTCM